MPVMPYVTQPVTRNEMLRVRTVVTEDFRPGFTSEYGVAATDPTPVGGWPVAVHARVVSGTSLCSSYAVMGTFVGDVITRPLRFMQTLLDEATTGASLPALQGLGIYRSLGSAVASTGPHCSAAATRIGLARCTGENREPTEPLAGNVSNMKHGINSSLVGSSPSSHSCGVGALSIVGGE